MPKANEGPSTSHQQPKEIVGSYALEVTDNRLDRADIRPHDMLVCVQVSKDVELADLHRKLVHVRRTRRFGDEEIITDDVWRAKMLPDGRLSLATESTIDDYSFDQPLLYPTYGENDTLEIVGRVTGSTRDVDHLEVPILADQLWTEPEVAEPSYVFARYLAMRDHFRKHIANASKAPEPESGHTETDRLCALLFEAACAVIHRVPTAPSDAVEIAIVVRDHHFDPGKGMPHSVINGERAARLIAALLTIATRQRTKH